MLQNQIVHMFRLKIKFQEGINKLNEAIFLNIIISGYLM